jgi:hypothetical protein
MGNIGSHVTLPWSDEQIKVAPQMQLLGNEALRLE